MTRDASCHPDMLALAPPGYEFPSQGPSGIHDWCIYAGCKADCHFAYLLYGNSVYIHMGIGLPHIVNVALYLDMQVCVCDLTYICICMHTYICMYTHTCVQNSKREMQAESSLHASCARRACACIYTQACAYTWAHEHQVRLGQLTHILATLSKKTTWKLRTYPV